MRKLFIVLALCGVSILNAQQLNVASYNVRNSNPNDAKAGNGWEQRCPVLTQLITFHDFDIFGAQEVKHNQLEDMLNALPQYSYIGVGRDDGKTKGEYAPIFYRKDKFKLLKSGNFGYRKIPRSRIKDGMQPIPASVHGENSRILQASSDSGSLTCTWTISE